MFVAVSMLFIGSKLAVAANLTVVQEELPVGKAITVGGVAYQMVQFEVPSFENDKIYLVKFPSASGEYFSGNVSVYGSTTPQFNFMQDTINASTTGLNGFKAFYDESYNYNADYYFDGSDGRISNYLNLANRVVIQLDKKTSVSLLLGEKSTRKNVSIIYSTPDTTTKLKAAPTALTKSQRNKFLLDSRALFKYVSIKEKL